MASEKGVGDDASQKARFTLKNRKKKNSHKGTQRTQKTRNYSEPVFKVAAADEEQGADGAQMLSV